MLAKAAVILRYILISELLKCENMGGLKSKKYGFCLGSGYQKPETDIQVHERRASLVAQWLRICLLMQGTRVQALVWEDPTCHGGAGPVSHSC